MNEQNKPAGNHIWKVGDKARIIGNSNYHQFEIGETVKLVGSGGVDWNAEHLDGHNHWLVQERDIEPLENKSLRDWTLGEAQKVCEGCDEQCRGCPFTTDAGCRIYGRTPNMWDLSDKPRFTADEVADAKVMQRMFPEVVTLSRGCEGHLICGNKYRMVQLVLQPDAKVFPSLLPGQAVNIADVIKN